MATPFTVADISHHLDLLSEVKALGDAHKDLLGFFPDGAFNEHAARGQILVAVSDEFLGYLLFRVTQGRARITHLCVKPEARGRGVAARLIDHLSDLTSELRGIGLRCRRDFKANTFWPRLGFQAIGTVRGRGRQTTELTEWWLDHGHPDLFTRVEEDTALSVAIDRNVFLDIEVSGRPDAEESMALLADWIQPHIHLLLTPEMKNEVVRIEDSGERQDARKRIAQYDLLQADVRAFKAQRDKLATLLNSRSPRDESDINHLAWVAASDTAVFVTRDERLLEHANQIYDIAAVAVVRPAQLITDLEEFRGEARAQPIRLSGTLLRLGTINSYDEAALVEGFYDTGAGERKHHFLRLLRSFCAAPDRYEVQTVQGVQSGENVPLALIVLDRSERDVLRVPLLRTSKHKGAPAVAENLLFYALKRAAHELRSFLVVDDGRCAVKPTVFEAMDFADDGGRWVRVVLPGAFTYAELEDQLRLVLHRGRFAGHLNKLCKALETPGPLPRYAYSQLERYLWPAKIVDASIPTFVVPIQPIWASHLFDEGLANQTLFGAREHLALNRDGVYYRSCGWHGGIEAPGRILWYVSSGSRKYSGASAIRACSILDSVERGKPGTLYRRYRRLGVFSWEKVLDRASGNPEREVMALRFSDTEVFSRPIPFEEAQKLLADSNVSTSFQSPVRIPPSAFESIYRIGTQDP